MTANDAFITGDNAASLQPFNPQPTFTSSTPRTVAVINGTRYVPIDVEVNGNAHGATGDATITLAIGNNPDFSVVLQRGDDIPMGLGFTLSDNSSVYAEIFFGYPNPVSVGSTDISQLQRVFIGILDLYSATFHDDAVTFTCRSLAAPLVDNDLTRLTMSEHSTDFAATAAAVGGMTLVPILPSGYEPITIQEVLAAEFVGGANFATAIYKKKWWDMLLQCALFDNTDVWVDQDKLYYAAPSLIQRTHVPLLYGRDVSLDGGLTGSHSIQFNKNIQIELHSYQRRTKTVHRVKIASDGFGGYTATQTSSVVSTQPIFGTPDTVTTSVASDGTVTVASSSSSGGGATGVKTGEGSESGKERYVEFVRNVSQDRLNVLAQSLWRQYSQHEYTVDLTVPARPQFLAAFNDMRTVLDVTGVPYKNFNGTYYPRKRTLRVSVAEGASWRFQCVNTPPPQGAV